MEKIEENGYKKMSNHYRTYKIECIEFAEEMNFNTGNAVKYLWRHLEKGEPIEDIKKAIYYVERERSRVERVLGNRLTYRVAQNGQSFNAFEGVEFSSEKQELAIKELWRYSNNLHLVMSDKRKKLRAGRLSVVFSILKMYQEELEAKLNG